MILTSLHAMTISPAARETIIRSIQPFVEGKVAVRCLLREAGEPEATLLICDDSGKRIELTGCDVLREDGNVDLFYIGLTSRQLPAGDYVIDTIEQARIEGWYAGDDDE